MARMEDEEHVRGGLREGVGKGVDRVSSGRLKSVQGQDAEEWYKRVGKGTKTS